MKVYQAETTRNSLQPQLHLVTFSYSTVTFTKTKEIMPVVTQDTFGKRTKKPLDESESGE